jgi:hypothetical protein
MKRDFLVYLEDILDAMDNAEMFVEGMSYEQFEDDLRANFAVARALEIPKTYARQAKALGISRRFAPRSMS